MVEKMKVDISIVIPMYNEVKILAESIEEIISTMDITKFGYELILIDDASQDGTVALARDLCRKWPSIRLLTHKNNQGRGATVAEGIKIAKGQIAGFIDIDLSTNPIYIPLLASKIRDGVEVATANRIYKFSFRSIHRWLMSKGYNTLFRFSTGIQLKDTETGCKFFNRERILPVLDEIKDRHWFWDTEVMARPYLKGFRIEEVPTIFVRRQEHGSTVKVIRDSLRHFLNLIRFRRVVIEQRKHFLPYTMLRPFSKGHIQRWYLFLKCKVLPMRRLERMIPREGRILDLGCGKGIFSSYLAITSQKRDVLGVDLCSKKVESAQRAFGSISNLRFVIEDVLKLLPNEKNLSGIIISDFLQHIDFSSQEELLKLAYRSLSYRGVLVVKEINKGNSLRYFLSKLAERLLYFGDEIYFRPQNKWVALLKDIGFQAESRSANTIFSSTVLYICKRPK